MASSMPPILASELVDREVEKTKSSLGLRTWSTREGEIDRKLPLSLWTSGKMIGVLSKDEHQLIEQIISCSLLSSPESTAEVFGSSSGFIIAPHHSNIITNVHDALLKYRLDLPHYVNQRSAAQCLESMQVLQYFDFSGLTESVAEVSARLFEISGASERNSTILYIEGLGSAIQAVQRRSGLVHANAILSSVLRSLTHLSRTYSSLFLLLGLVWTRDTKHHDLIQSAFASATGQNIMMQPGDALARTLEGATDIVVLVHDTHSTTIDRGAIVEVVKDRVGGTLGEWAVWKND